MFIGRLFRMYIALRWLVGLSFAMWVAVCCVHFYTESKGCNDKEFIENLFKSENISKPIKKEGIDSFGRKPISPKHEDTAIIYCYAMFFVGALAVSVLNRKNEIIIYTRRKLLLFNVRTATFIREIDLNKFKLTAMTVSVGALKYATIFWKYCKKIISYSMNRKALQTGQTKLIELFLKRKLQEYDVERKKLGKLYNAVIRENKNIWMRFQLETRAKKRLLQSIEDTQKQVKENRSKYVTFQRLYLVTHQENIFLSKRLEKVCQEKEDAEHNFMSLVNAVYQSNSYELKAYCSRFIVKTRERVLNCNLHAEIKTFLLNNSRPAYHNSSNLIDSEADTRITEILPEHGTLIPHSWEAPKLNGLPGECIWTVKDKNGIIEKLYECDYETDLDNGDTVQRIRKYSVYHNKGCLLDHTNSRTAISDLNVTNTSLIRQQYFKVECPIMNHRFLTGSRVFLKFLRDNQNLIRVQSSQTPALLFE